MLLALLYGLHFAAWLGGRADGGFQGVPGQHQRNCGYFTCRPLKIKQNAQRGGGARGVAKQVAQFVVAVVANSSILAIAKRSIRIAHVDKFCGGSNPPLPLPLPHTHTTLIPNRKSQFSGKFAGLLVITLNHFVFYFPQSVWLGSDGGRGGGEEGAVCLWPLLVFTFLPAFSYFLLRCCFWPVFFGPFHKCSHKSAFSLPRIDF